MTDSPKTALATFLATAKRIEGLLEAADAARHIPESRASLARCVEIRTQSWGNAEAQARATEAASRIRTKLVDEYRAEGETARDARLAEIAEELRVIRLGLAAYVSILEELQSVLVEAAKPGAPASEIQALQSGERPEHLVAMFPEEFR